MILDERNITNASAAKSLGISENIFSEFADGKTRCSIEMARRLSKATYFCASGWIDMQATLDIWEAENLVLDTEVTKIDL